MTTEPGQSIADLLQEEAVLKALEDRVKARLKTVKESVQERIDQVKEATGAAPGKMAALLPDGTPVATVYGSGSGEPVAAIDDPDAFLAWAVVNAKTEIVREIVTTVRPSYITKILGEMTAAGTNRIADVDTGEITEVPGVTVKPRRSRTHSIRLKPGAQEAIDKAWQAGTLNVPGITRPEITSE